MKKYDVPFLNPEQQKACQIPSGPILILAGAGSGKTTVITHRIAWLIKQGIKPYHILGVTFTNKAAGEMKERLRKLLSQKHTAVVSNTKSFKFQHFPLIGTFHAICAKILRQEIKILGFKPNFVIYDENDSLTAIKKVMRGLSIGQEKINPKAILARISGAKMELVSPEEYEAYASDFFEKKVLEIYRQYQKFLKQNNALDFDDLIFKVVEIFRKSPRVLEKYQQRFRHILVDEYQDTNHSQYVFVNLLAKKFRNICVVGDDWQSIYGWRGADIRNILDFEKDYPEANIIRLEQNYRSTQNILDASHEVISKNPNQKEKRLWTKKKQGTKPIIYEAFDEEDEARFVIREIKKIVSKNTKLSLNDFVVLYRVNAQSRALEEVFMEERIPYRIIGGVRFYDRKEIKDILAFLKLILNPQDCLSFRRIVNVPPRGIGSKTLAFVEKQTHLKSKDLIFVIKEMLALGKFSLKVRQAFSEFINLMEKLALKSKKLNISDLIDFLLKKSGYQDFLLANKAEGEERLENIQELKTVAAPYHKDLRQFLEDVSLLSDIDELDEKNEAVTLMTCHAAKGLEYEVVFMVGMEEELFPHSKSLTEPAELEEERRLCYVGMTRAKERLYLIFAQARKLFGSFFVGIPSRFLEDISDEFVQRRRYIGQRFRINSDDQARG